VLMMLVESLPVLVNFETLLSEVRTLVNLSPGKTHSHAHRCSPAAAMPLRGLCCQSTSRTCGCSYFTTLKRRCRWTCSLSLAGEVRFPRVGAVLSTRFLLTVATSIYYRAHVGQIFVILVPMTSTVEAPGGEPWASLRNVGLSRAIIQDTVDQRGWQRVDQRGCVCPCHQLVPLFPGDVFVSVVDAEWSKHVDLQASSSITKESLMDLADRITSEDGDGSQPVWPGAPHGEL
jgi:hypothetical protein